MKKSLSAIIAVLLVTVMSTMSVFAYTDAYPFSKDNGFDPGEGEILIGELFGTASWNNGENTYDKAWDGDIASFYDPSAAGDTCYTGVKLSEEYILTEIRIHPRSGFLNRYYGATIQGSNDGEKWTDIYVSDADAETADYVIIKAADFIAGSNIGFSYYRYINTGIRDNAAIHGDVSEVELYGEVKNKPEPIIEEVVVEAPKPEEAVIETPAPAPVVSPQTNDNFIVSASLLSAALVAMFIVMKKKVSR